MRVGIVVFDGVDLMDVAGPYEVLTTASRLEQRQGREPTFEIVVIGPTSSPVTAFGGMGIVPHSAVSDIDDLDIVVVPGAVAIDEVEARPGLLRHLQGLAELAQVTASVCTGAFLLEKAGLVDGRRVTTHWEDVEALRDRAAVAEVRDDVRWVDDGDVVTAGGLSSGIAMALHLVERFAGRELAEATARQIDYVWTEERG